MPRPSPADYASFYAGYVDRVPEDDVVPALIDQKARTLAFLRDVREDEAGNLHSPYTWTPRQVLGHVLDAERVFTYRALRFARNDPRELASFDEHLYVNEGGFDARSFAGLVDEYEALRTATLCLFQNLKPDAWDRRGVANGASVTVRALAYITLGHERHHLGILAKRLGRSF